LPACQFLFSMQTRRSLLKLLPRESASATD
jgi:hypothetical protein